MHLWAGKERDIFCFRHRRCRNYKIVIRKQLVNVQSFILGDTLIRTEQAMVYNYKKNKVTQIAQEIGRRPVLSFGNSSGDVSMLNYTICDNPYMSLAFMLIADDAERDYGEREKNCVSDGKSQDIMLFPWRKTGRRFMAMMW